MTQIVPVTDFLRNFGKYADLLPKLDELILTRDGRPFANLKASPEEKHAQMMKTAGILKGTPLDDDKLWNDVLKKNSRKKPIKL